MIEAILNRLRGTGTLIDFGYVKNVHVTFNGNHLYGLYLALIIGFLTNIYGGITVLIAYLLGESKGWGEWVGALTRWEPKDEQWLKAQYIDDEGTKFPFIHQTANFLVPERIEGSFSNRLIQYKMYAFTALTIRGFYWWLPVYMVIATLGLITFSDALLVSAVLGVSFPLACIVGKHWKFTKKYGILSFSRGWENQEIVYGLIQGLVFWVVLLC